jgi:hypothetical protein
MTDVRTYKYAVVQEGNAKYVDVEMAGRVALNKGEDPEKRAKMLIVSTQQVPEENVKLEKVDNVQDSVITSQQTTNK